MPIHSLHHEKGEAATWIIIALILLFGLFLYIHHKDAPVPAAPSAPLGEYKNLVYQVTLAFPADWQFAPNYGYERYQGASGFFGVSGSTSNAPIDTVAKNEINAASKPYGSEPTVQTLTVGGQDARLILPSSDADPTLQGQAELAVAYPKPVEFAGQKYYYFILLADQNDIKTIGASVQFIISQ